MKYTLIYEQDENYGVNGFRIAGSKINPEAYNMATEGLLVAHDIVEHRSIKKIGTIGDELIALGAIWYVRGEYGDLRRDRGGSRFSPQENVASDVVNMGRDIIANGKRYYEKVPAGIIEDNEFKSIIDYARKGLISELEGEKYIRSDVTKYLNDAYKFMAHGYHQAENRFKRIGGQMAANNLFWNIAEVAGDALKHAEFEGQQFALHVNMIKNKVYFEEIYVE